jgi:hypothetical protein
VPFDFDEEILLFPQRLTARTSLIRGTGWQQFAEFARNYTPPRRFMQITLRTDGARAVHSPTPIMWSIDPADRVPTIGEIKNVFDSPI